ncbi:MAG: TonB-dependent receptor [Marinilabiliaceae bacterium]|nr:TonB-dependent receptor [Marinilabiliaceae bacterium]
MPKKSTWRHCLATFVLSILSLSLYAQAQTVNGIVKEKNGDPIIGVSILEKGTTNGTVTDIDGKFTIKAGQGATLIISYLGYQTQEIVPVPNTLNEVVLTEDTESLEEVVVVGYGTQKKKLVTGATIQVSGDELVKQNATNPIGGLYSSVPGVNIVASNGQPGADYKVTIRGLNTTGSSKPLYVIDGVAGGDISALNPSDIESIDILKDAASAAIYGARASAGVILITTKQGVKDKIHISYDGYFSIQKPQFNGVKAVDGMKYIELVDEAMRSNNAKFNSEEHYFNLEAIMPVQWKEMKAGTFKGTDWLRESINPDSYAYNHALTIAGGNETSHYSFGISHSNTDGTLGYPKETYYKRTTIRMNSDYVLLRAKDLDMIKLAENFTLSLYSSNGVRQGNIYDNTIYTALNYTPLLPAYKKDGSFYTWEDQKADGWQQSEGAYNLLEDYALGEQENKNLRIQGNVWLEINPHKEWKFRSTYGFRYHNTNNRSYTPAYALSSNRQEMYDRASQSSSASSHWTWENTISWKHQFDEHGLDIILGNSIEGTGWGQSLNGSRKQTKFHKWESANLGSSDSDIDSENVSIGGSNTIPYNDLVSFFGRVNYNFRETYLATLIMREDGSSNFAKGERWGFFPSVSAGWVLSNESFLENTSGWLDFLKLRASWGQNGNCSITPFQYAATVSLSAPYDFTSTGSSTSTGAYPDIIPNPELTWETTEQTDIGIDARFLSSRLGVTFDWYNKETKDWLVDAPALASYGTGSPTINGGSVRNRGVELGLTWNDHAGDFKYSANFNISTNKNEVLYIDNADGILRGATNVIAQNISTYETYEARPGKPIGYFTGLASAGIFQNQKQIDEYNAKNYTFMDGYENAKPGDVIWIDQNNDGTYDNDDVVEIGNPHPDVNIGFSINLEWKGIDFAISGSGAFGHQILQSYRSFANSDFQNYTTNFVDRLWTGEGSTNKFPRFTYGKHNNFYAKGYVGDIWCQDADYVKIRTITLGYNFKSLFKNMPLQQCRIYFTGQNLLTFTKYDGMDPEVGYGASHSWASGIDLGTYPNPRCYMFGMSLKF